MIFFVSNNIHKFSEIKSILRDRTTDLTLNFYKRNIIEIQDDKIEKIAVEKQVIEVYAVCIIVVSEKIHFFITVIKSDT